MPAFLMVALVTRWLQDGSADAIIGAILNEASARQRLAADVLVQHAYSRHPNGHHIWVPLPRNCPQLGQEEFASHVQRQGLAIVTAESFSVVESQPNAIRVSLGAASSRAELFRALEILAAALKSSAARARVV
jgi:DNA-binding transcriptional MocR family regulator